MSETPLLKLQDVNKQYGAGCIHCRNHPASLIGNYCAVCGTVYALRHANLELYKGEILGIVGESGSGKSTLMRLMYFDEPVTTGTYHLQAYEEGKVNLFEAARPAQRWVRNILLGMVYQNPLYGLRMHYSSMANIAEKMIAADFRNVAHMRGIAENLLDRVHIPVLRARETPAGFSGGMQQRVQIAKALSNDPPILLLDEVTTGLDLSVQADVLDLIKAIQRDLKISMVVVSHDLSVVRMLADRTIVMYQGEMIEHGLTDQILEDPQHEYTQQLVYSLL